MTFSELKIHVHDFAGHPFQAELSNELSNMGYEVIHTYFLHGSVPKAKFEDLNSTGKIKFQAIRLNQKYENQNLTKRILFEFGFFLKLLKVHFLERPNINMFANTPLLTAILFRVFARGSVFVLWHQDIFSSAIRLLFESGQKPLSFIRERLVWIVKLMESWLVNRSAWVICISESFLEMYKSWKVDLKKVTVIENWAPLNQFTFTGSSFFSVNSPKFLYAGTLGLKHNPQLLIDFMRKLENTGLSPQLKVISQGQGAEYLRQNYAKNNAIEIKDFVTLNELNSELKFANFTLMILEEGASNFSVPSKTYSYLSAGKCVIAFAPSDNAACLAISKAGSPVFEPSSAGIESAAEVVSSLDVNSLQNLEKKSREFALSNFDVGRKAEAFSRIFQKSYLG